MTIATIDTRRRDDYHDVEDPLEYISERGHTPGQWIGHVPDGLKGKSVNVQDFARKSFGFGAREIGRDELAETHGVSPELEAWAVAQIELWRFRKHDELLADLDRRISKASGDLDARRDGLTPVAAAALERRTARMIASLEAERGELVRSHAAQRGRGGERRLRSEAERAKRLALDSETAVMRNADPAGLVLSLLKTRMSKLEAERAGGIGDPARAAIVEAETADIEKRIAPFLGQAALVESTRERGEAMRERAKTMTRFAQAADTREEAAMFLAAAEEATEDAEASDMLLKDMPCAFSQGISLTLSWHKSISLALVSADQQTRERLMEVLERTNREWIEKVGQRYARARTSRTVVGPDGERRVEIEYHKVRGVTAASFFHPDARPDSPGAIAKPSAHFHNEIVRDVETLDGRTLALDTDYIRQNLKAAGAEAAAMLAGNLRAAGFTPDCYKTRGGEYVGLAGFTDGEIERNSERARSIRERRAAGASDAQAWAETRHGKTLTPDELEPLWRQDLAEQGIHYAERHGDLKYGNGKRERAHVSSDAELIEKLWEREAYFSLADIREAVFREAAWDPTGEALAQADARVERIASNPDLRLADMSKYDALVGRSRHDEPVYVPLSLARGEMRMFDDLVAMHNESRWDIRGRERTIRRLERRKTAELRGRTGDRKAVFKYRPDQLLAIETATRGNGLFLISALAGTGKTTSLEGIIEVFEANRKKVLLCAAWNKAASQISADTGKRRGEDVHTIAKLVREIGAGRIKVDRDTVIIVDEAGLASHREMAALTDICREFGCSLGLQGDENQTAAVSTGKPFRRLVESGAFEVGTIDKITRQSDADQKRATELAARGMFAETIQIYRDAGTVQDGFADRDAAVSKLADDFMACRDDVAEKIAIASRNADVAALNAEIRERLVAAGALRGGSRRFVTSTDRHVELAAGDRICLSERLSVGEGRGAETIGEKSEFGTILSVGPDGLTVLMDGRGEPRTIPADSVPDIQYGYAATVSKLQGSTFRTSFYLHSEFVNSALAYVALSRHKLACHVYATIDQARTMASDMSRAERKIDALDLLSAADIEELASREGLPADQARAAREARAAAEACRAALRPLTPAVAERVLDTLDGLADGVRAFADSVRETVAKAEEAARVAAARVAVAFEAASPPRARLLPPVVADMLPTADGLPLANALPLADRLPWADGLPLAGQPALSEGRVAGEPVAGTSPPSTQTHVGQPARVETESARVPARIPPQKTPSVSRGGHVAARGQGAFRPFGGGATVSADPLEIARRHATMAFHEAAKTNGHIREKLGDRLQLFEKNPPTIDRPGMHIPGILLGDGPNSGKKYVSCIVAHVDRDAGKVFLLPEGHTRLIEADLEKSPLDDPRVNAADALGRVANVLVSDSDVVIDNPPSVIRATYGKNAGKLSDAIAKGADMTAVDGRGRTALHHAVINDIKHGVCERTRILVEAGLDLWAKDFSGESPADMLMAMKGDEASHVGEGVREIARFISEHLKPAPGDMVRAARGGDFQTVASLMRRGLSPLDSDTDGNIALHHASERAHVEILTTRGDGERRDAASQVWQRNVSGRLPLHAAALGGHYEAVHAILKIEPKQINVGDGDGLTPLHIAAATGNHDLALMLIVEGADVEATDLQGRTPLHLAALNGRAATVKLLLDSGVNLEARHAGGRTALHFAVEADSVDVTEMLLARGADPVVVDSQHRFPSDLAQSGGACSRLLGEALSRAYEAETARSAEEQARNTRARVRKPPAPEQWLSM